MPAQAASIRQQEQGDGEDPPPAQDAQQGIVLAHVLRQRLPGPEGTPSFHLDVQDDHLRLALPRCHFGHEVGDAQLLRGQVDHQFLVHKAQGVEIERGCFLRKKQVQELWQEALEKLLEQAVVQRAQLGFRLARHSWLRRLLLYESPWKSQSTGPSWVCPRFLGESYIKRQTSNVIRDV
jgi:hypothetical protein